MYEKGIRGFFIGIFAVILLILLTVFFLFPSCVKLARKVGNTMEKAEYIGWFKIQDHQPDEELPLFENGKYLFVDKHPELKNSTNVICVMYDEDSGKFYYFTRDT